MERFGVRHLQVFAWGLSTAVTLVAVIAWGQLYQWQISSAYQLFPLFGLLAFSLMWSHYIVSVVRHIYGLERAVIERYFTVTSSLVLLSILLHPGILTWQLLKDGLGWPPLSYFDYVGDSLHVFIVIAEVALLFFLCFELGRWFSKRHWWPYVAHLSDIGMVLIFLHSFRLGSHLQTGWFKTVWYFYGVTLVAALIFIYERKYREWLVKKA